MKPLRQALRAQLMTGSRLQPLPRVYRTEPGHQKTPSLLLMSNKAQSSILSLSKWLKQKADSELTTKGADVQQKPENPKTPARRDTIHLYAYVIPSQASESIVSSW